MSRRDPRRWPGALAEPLTSGLAVPRGGPVSACTLKNQGRSADIWSIPDFTRIDVAHLLRRAGFGGRAADIDALVALPDWASVVDRVLDTTANPPDTIPAAVDDLSEPYYRPWVASVYYWMDRMATTPTPIVEKMTLFWHGLLTSSVDDVLARILHRQLRTWRANCLGDVHTLYQAMAIDAGMLLYLNNGNNYVEKPNENFGRELMELFTLGNGQFTEADVTEMARAWTGYNLSDNRQSYQWRPDKHDNGTKTLFGVTRNWDGPETITEIIRGSRQPTFARYLAAKVWSFFAYPNPAPELVDALAAAFIASGMNAKELVRAVFLRPEFRLASTRAALVRSPVEWLVAGMRSTNLTCAEVHPEWWLDRIGQRLYAPPNVSGWRQNGAWISSSTYWGRAACAGFIRWVANDKGFLAATATMTPAAAADTVFAQFGIDEPSSLSRTRIEQYVAREQAARRPWAIAPNLVTLTMLTPDFQLA